MASKTYKAIYNRKAIPNQVEAVAKTILTKAEAEEQGLGKEPIVITGPVEEGKVIEVKAETEAIAAKAVRLFVGADEGEGEFLFAEVANVKKSKGR